MSDEEARVVYEDARLGQSVELGKNLTVLVDFDFGFTGLARSIGSDRTDEVEATKRVLDAVRAREHPVLTRFIESVSGKRPVTADADGGDIY